MTNTNQTLANNSLERAYELLMDNDNFKEQSEDGVRDTLGRVSGLLEVARTAGAMAAVEAQSAAFTRNR